LAAYAFFILIARLVTPVTTRNQQCSWAAISVSGSVSVLFVPEMRTGVCYNGSTRSLPFCSVLFQGAGFLGFPLGLSPLLLSIAEVQVFFGSSISYHSNMALLSTSVEPANLHPNQQRFSVLFQYFKACVSLYAVCGT